MKKTLLSAVLAATFGIVALAPQYASASDGTITFNGLITDTTCDVSPGAGAGGSGSTITVNLPPVSASALSSGGQTAGETPFSLNLSGTNCAAGKTAALWIETSETPVDMSTGALFNQNTGAGGAANVEVQMINPGNGNKIDLSTNGIVVNGQSVIAANNQPTAIIQSGNTGTLSYVARYLATDAATSGTVSSYLTYSMQYN